MSVVVSDLSVQKSSIDRHDGVRGPVAEFVEIKKGGLLNEDLALSHVTEELLRLQLALIALREHTVLVPNVDVVQERLFAASKDCLVRIESECLQNRVRGGALHDIDYRRVNNILEQFELDVSYQAQELGAALKGWNKELEAELLHRGILVERTAEDLNDLALPTPVQVALDEKPFSLRVIVNENGESNIGEIKSAFADGTVWRIIQDACNTARQQSAIMLQDARYAINKSFIGAVLEPLIGSLAWSESETVVGQAIEDACGPDIKIPSLLDEDKIPSSLEEMALNGKRAALKNNLPRAVTEFRKAPLDRLLEDSLLMSRRLIFESNNVPAFRQYLECGHQWLRNVSYGVVYDLLEAPVAKDIMVGCHRTPVPPERLAARSQFRSDVLDSLVDHYNQCASAEERVWVLEEIVKFGVEAVPNIVALKVDDVTNHGRHSSTLDTVLRSAQYRHLKSEAPESDRVATTRANGLYQDWIRKHFDELLELGGLAYSIKQICQVLGGENGRISDSSDRERLMSVYSENPTEEIAQTLRDYGLGERVDRTGIKFVRHLGSSVAMDRQGFPIHVKRM